MRVTIKHPWVPEGTDGGHFVATVVMVGKPSLLKKAEREIRKAGRVAGLRYARPVCVGTVSNGGSLKITVSKPLYSSDLKQEVCNLQAEVTKWLVNLSQ